MGILLRFIAVAVPDTPLPLPRGPGTAHFMSPRASPRASRARRFLPTVRYPILDIPPCLTRQSRNRLGFQGVPLRQTEMESLQMGNLLHYAIVFLIVAIIAAFLGFGGVAGTAMEGARLLFWIAIVLFVLALIGNFMRRA